MLAVTELQRLLTTPLLKAARRADHVQCHHSSRFYGFSFYLPHEAIYHIARDCQTKTTSCALGALAESGAAVKSHGPKARPGWGALSRRGSSRGCTTEKRLHTPPPAAAAVLQEALVRLSSLGSLNRETRASRQCPACPWTVLCRGRRGRHCGALLFALARAQTAFTLLKTS